MARYVIERINVTPVSGNDILSVISAASRRVRLVDVSVTGVGTTSASQALQIGRATAGTTPGGAIVPSKADNSDQPASTFTTATTWSVQPTVETNAIAVGWNAIGGNWIKNFTKGVFEARNGDVISVRAIAGVTYQPMNISIIVEED